MLTSAELLLIADEIQQLSAGGRVDRIHQPRPDRIVIRLAREGDERNLLIAAARSFARAHFVEDPPANPRTPPPFCEDLRRLLMPGRLVKAATLPHDAVLLLDFDVRDENGATVARRLIAELFGANPNILVLGPEGAIEAVLFPRESKYRKLLPGQRYVEPGRPKKDVAPTRPFSELGEAPAETTVSRLLEESVGPRESEALLAESREALAGTLKQEEKKLRRRLENIDADVKSAEKIPQLRREGELLKAHLSKLKRGMKSFVATEWHGEREEQVTIALDPKRTPHEELSFRFEEAKRLERLKDAAAGRRSDVDERLRALDALAERIRLARSEEDLAAVGTEAGLDLRPQAAPAKKAAPKAEPRKPYRTFVSKDGIEMLVGRTARDNDELTFKLANGNDFWFHVRDYPGSHVLIRAMDELPQETLLDAATLAVHFSRGAAGGKRDVSWTRRKYVSKPRGAPAGQVLLSSHKTIHLRPDPARLARLLKG